MHTLTLSFWKRLFILVFHMERPHGPCSNNYYRVTGDMWTVTLAVSLTITFYYSCSRASLLLLSPSKLVLSSAPKGATDALTPRGLAPRVQVGGVGGRQRSCRLPPQLLSENRFLVKGPLKGPGST